MLFALCNGISVCWGVYRFLTGDFAALREKIIILHLFDHQEEQNVNKAAGILEN